jgi:hypothetical protein
MTAGFHSSQHGIYHQGFSNTNEFQAILRKKLEKKHASVHPPESMVQLSLEITDTCTNVAIQERVFPPLQFGLERA